MTHHHTTFTQERKKAVTKTNERRITIATYDRQQTTFGEDMITQYEIMRARQAHKHALRAKE